MTKNNSYNLIALKYIKLLNNIKSKKQKSKIKSLFYNFFSILKDKFLNINPLLNHIKKKSNL